MAVQVDVWSDFVCPWCYAVSLSLDELARTHGLNIRWHAYELRPEGSPPMDPAYLRHIEMDSRPRFNQLMEEQHGLKMNPGPFGILTRLPLRAAAYADVQGEALGHAFHDAMYRAYWLGGRDISDPDVIAEVAVQVGLDGEAVRAALDDPQFDAAVVSDIRTAYAYGFSGVPALLFENKYYVSGAQPLAVLQQVVERIEAGILERA